MTILGILLTILKIIGIILLVLLLLILTVILLVLFVPFRYRVHADKVGWDLNAGANVSWLLHMISVDVGYGIRESGYGGGLTKDIRIFGISLFKLRDRLSKRKRKKSQKEPEPSSVESESQAGEILKADSESITEETPDIASATMAGESTGAETDIEAGESTGAEADIGAGESTGAEADIKAGESTGAETDIKAGESTGAETENETDTSFADSESAEAGDAGAKRRSLPDRVFGRLQKAQGLLLSLPGRMYEILVTVFMKILEFFTMFCGIPGRFVAVFGAVIDKMLTIFGKITLITDFFFDDRTQDAIHLLFGKTGNLLGHIRPRKLSGYLDFGFDDPSITGRVLGVLSVFLPQVGKTFDINPDFEKSHLECDITSSGRIYLFYLIYIAASTYFNKNIKYVIRYVKHLRKELSQA